MSQREVYTQHDVLQDRSQKHIIGGPAAWVLRWKRLVGPTVHSGQVSNPNTSSTSSHPYHSNTNTQIQIQTHTDTQIPAQHSNTNTQIQIQTHKDTQIPAQPHPYQINA